jgi:hypothetical protein
MGAPKQIDPRDAADMIESACLLVPRGGTIKIAVGDALIIAELLRRVPLQQRRPPLTARQRRNFLWLVEKARHRKEKLVAEGKSATEAEELAAKWARDSSHYAVSTIVRAMRNHTDR